MSNNGYITGSRAYGIPSDESDIDLVVCLPREDIEKLWSLTEGSITLMFGKLNLVAFNIDDPEDMERYKSWSAAHDRLMAIKPVTKERAIQEFREANAESAYTVNPKSFYRSFNYEYDDSDLPF